MRLGSARIVLLLALLSSAPAARTDFVLDPAKVPASFSCAAEWDAKRCASERRHETWWDEYRERYDHWYHQMLFDTATYFAKDAVADPAAEPEKDDEPWEPETALAGRTGNLVDTVYQVALRRFTRGWGFAIAMDCSGSAPGCTPGFAWSV